ncbi:MAG: Na+/H+ antiporter NhaA [Gammaproteobacteria bacterium]|nr:Na+/H+ antiporter NhaA [Gammaproteobacteria bacterium]MDH5729494.1 Na+/H+ antiporter NhaA [Gammaproteobacteria bacterium]
MSQDKHPIQEENFAPLEKVFDKIVSPFEEFIHRETTSGLLLMICAIIALIVANSPLVHSYEHILHTKLSIALGDWHLSKTLHHWINDGLMALFFFVVGLEIKREVLVGELADPRQAALPIIAAIGGMVVPASIYFLMNNDPSMMKGWGIPMATDIAFAVGVIALLGARVPKTLLMFLVALAIVDDLGAVVVIAIFYTETIDMNALLTAGGLFAVLVFFNRVGIRTPLPYFLVGLCLWVAMLKSGVHATLAGVLTALTIPASTKFSTGSFSQLVRKLMDKFDAHHRPNQGIMRNEEQRSIIQTLENGVHLVETPLQRLEHSMHMPVAFIIIPIFALANAGVPIDFSTLGSSLTHPVTISVIVALVAGKLIGIAGVSWIAVKAGIATLPAGTNFHQLIGVGFLGGIGFTMSIFIGELAFPGDAELLLMAKTGILAASIIAGVVGYLWLLKTAKPIIQK